MTPEQQAKMQADMMSNPENIKVRCAKAPRLSPSHPLQTASLFSYTGLCGVGS